MIFRRTIESDRLALPRSQTLELKRNDAVEQSSEVDQTASHEELSEVHSD